jgi:hypothetical protein
MSLFDKLRQRRTLQSSSSLDDVATEWLKEYEQRFSQCDQSARPGFAGTSPENVRAAIMPLMVWGMEPVKDLCAGLVAAFCISRHLPNVAVRVMGCEDSKCNGLSTLITKPAIGIRQRCPHCGKEQKNDVPFLEYSQRVGRQLQQMFADHSICMHKFERAKTLEVDCAQDALLLYDEAEAISRGMGNHTVSSMILIHKARVFCFKLYKPSVAIQLANEALDMAHGLKHLHRKEQLAAAVADARQVIVDLHDSFNSADP